MSAEGVSQRRMHRRAGVKGVKEGERRGDLIVQRGKTTFHNGFTKQHAQTQRKPPAARKSPHLPQRARRQTLGHGRVGPDLGLAAELRV